MPLIEVSYGELADKWTILQIKSALLKDLIQLKNLSVEISHLAPLMEEMRANSSIQLLIEQLKETNLTIWNLMEKLYQLQPNAQTKYISLTLEITEQNQKRAFLKREIDAICQSSFTEAKSFFENPSFVIRAVKNED